VSVAIYKAPPPPPVVAPPVNTTSTTTPTTTCDAACQALLATGGGGPSTVVAGQGKGGGSTPTAAPVAACNQAFCGSGGQATCATYTMPNATAYCRYSAAGVVNSGCGVMVAATKVVCPVAFNGTPSSAVQVVTQTATSVAVAVGNAVSSAVSAVGHLLSGI
jgi:hypothetical protein